VSHYRELPGGPPSRRDRRGRDHEHDAGAGLEQRGSEGSRFDPGHRELESQVQGGSDEERQPFEERHDPDRRPQYLLHDP
jgi:hypothetical protein